MDAFHYAKLKMRKRCESIHYPKNISPNQIISGTTLIFFKHRSSCTHILYPEILAENLTDDTCADEKNRILLLALKTSYQDLLCTNVLIGEQQKSTMHKHFQCSMIDF